MLLEGRKAPSFSLPSSEGKKTSLKDFTGKKVVLYFYPKDMTPGCTKEACEFSHEFETFKGLKAEIIGISTDSVESHRKFIKKYDLPFILLSDSEKKVSEKYGVWKEKSMYGKKYFGIERTTFIIDENGIITKIFPRVKAEGHAREVRAVLAGEE